MKKKVGIVVVIGIMLLGTSTLAGINAPILENARGKHNEITALSMNFSPPKIKENHEYTLIESDMAYLMNEDFPILPYKTEVMTFPLGTTIKDIGVTTSEVKTMQLGKKIMPASAPISFNMKDTQVEVKEGAVYESMDSYPSEWITYNIGAGIDGNEHVVFFSLHAFPARYTPSTNELHYVNEITIEINYVLPPKPLLINDEYDLVIITPLQFSDALQPLVEHKNNYGVATNLVTLDEIYEGNYFPARGRDDAEKIKYFLKDALESWGIRYVLFVGDINQVPSREVLSFWRGGKMFSDHYYADIYDVNTSFCSWDSNENNLFGETDTDDDDFVDLYADLYVGRLACNGLEEVTTMVNKIITYETTAYGKEWFDRLVLMGGDTFPRWNDVVEGEVVNEYVANVMPDFNHVRIQMSLHNFLPHRINQILSEGAGFVCYSGHGFEYGFGTYPKDSNWMIAYYTPYLLGLKNGDKLPVVFFDACLTAKLDYHMLGNSDIPCFAWCLVKKPDGGAIATIGATETATTSVDENGPHGQAGYLNLHFFMAYQLGIAVSEMLVKAQNDYLNDIAIGEANNHSYVMTIEQFILLGDPSLKVGGYP